MKNKLYILLFMQLLFTANSVAQKIGQETTQETTQEVHQKNCDCNYITSGYYQDMNNAQIEFIRGNNEKAYQYLRQAEKNAQ